MSTQQRGQVSPYKVAQNEIINPLRKQLQGKTADLHRRAGTYDIFKKRILDTISYLEVSLLDIEKLMK